MSVETFPGASFYTPYVSAGAHATTLAMTDEERQRAPRRPIGFVPPVVRRPAGKPRIRLKLSPR